MKLATSIDLDTCPFCDNTAELKNTDAHYWVECHACGARGPRHEHTNDEIFDSKSLAILSWNQTLM